MSILNKILNLFNAKEQKSFYLLLILMLVMAFFDMLGVASIFPFITVLTNPNLIETNIALTYLYEKSFLLGVNSKQDFLFLSGITVFILLILSLLLKGITNYAQISFSMMREYSIGKKLIEGYLHQPYSWFINKNSADIGKNILSEVNQVIIQTIFPVITLIAQSIITFLILLLLIIVDPIITLVVGFVLSISYLIIFFFIKNILTKIGIKRLNANKDRFNSITEAFGSFKETKLKALEENHINQFSKPAIIYAKSQSLATIIGQLPRYFLEAIGFGGLIILVLFLMAKNQNFSAVLPIITLYAFAGYRLMPALQQIYKAVTQIRFSKSSLETLHDDLQKLKIVKNTSNNKNPIIFKKKFTLRDINFKYHGTNELKLEDINLEILKNTKIGIVGTTGSGKTTLVDLILGLLDPISGNVLIDDKVMKSQDKKFWQSNIGYVPQEIYLKDSTIISNIAFGLEEREINIKSVEKASKISSLHNFVINELPDGYNTVVGERGVRLSGGQRQRIGIARALYHNPKLLVLDEATSALDNITEKAVIDSVNNLDNITTIMVAHRLSSVKNCDNIFLLEGGKLKSQGTYDELSQNDDFFNKMSKINT